MRINIQLKKKKPLNNAQFPIIFMEIVFLGTSSMVPTKERNQSSVFLSYGNEGILIDCGEGTQRQLKMAGIPVSKITKILISHWHGDHVLGLPGLMQTMSGSEYHKKLDIYGPQETQKRFEAMFRAFVFDKELNYEIFEIGEGKFFENDEYARESYRLDHHIECLGFVFKEKDKLKIDMKKAAKAGLKEGPLIGKLQQGETVMVNGKNIRPEDAGFVKKGLKIGLIADTLPCSNNFAIAKDADLLVCEATYASKLEEKGEDYYHMTAKQAALVASQADAKKLVLTHFSARYKDVKELEEDARSVFSNTVCAYDLMKIKM